MQKITDKRVKNMQKIKSQICIANYPNFIYELAQGYELEAWNNKMIVIKRLGTWQVYDVKSKMRVAGEHKTRKKAIEVLRQCEQDIKQSVYEKAVFNWINAQNKHINK